MLKIKTDERIYEYSDEYRYFICDRGLDNYVIALSSLNMNKLLKDICKNVNVIILNSELVATVYKIYKIEIQPGEKLPLIIYCNKSTIAELFTKNV